MKTIYRNLNILLLGIFISSCADTGQERDQFVQELLQEMTLDEKVGQMTQVDKRMLDSESDIATYYLGSILSGGGSVPKDLSLIHI